MAFELDTEILPYSWLDRNSLYPDYPALTWRRVMIILVSFVLFRSIKYALTKFFGVRKRRAFKVVSVVHSFIVSGGSFYVLTTNYSFFAYSNKDTCVPIQHAHYIFCVSLGYFLYDLYKTITEEPGLDFIVHGILSIGINIIVIHTGAGHGIMLKCLLFESSTIFLHAYAFLHYAHYDYMASIMRFIFAVLFFSLRILYGSFVAIQLCHAFIIKPSYIEWNCVAPYKYWAAIIINLSFYVLNIHWFRLIVNKALKVWKEGKHTLEQSGEELEFDKRREDQKSAFLAKYKKKEA